MKSRPSDPTIKNQTTLEKIVRGAFIAQTFAWFTRPIAEAFFSAMGSAG